MNPPTPQRPHGGPDAHGVARHDFSTGSHPLGPCPAAWQAVQAADARHYPDPASTALRQQLAAHHGVAVERVLVAASASEFIQRITTATLSLAEGAVELPAHSYGDYAAAAQAWGRPLLRRPREADTATQPLLWPPASVALRWCADPGSPCGQDEAVPSDLLSERPLAPVTVLDRAYTPLRLTGTSPWSTAACDAVFQLWTPNKALGLTGVRGAYALAPRHAPPALLQRVRALEPSWPLGAHAQALLHAWCTPEVAAWLAQQHAALVAAHAALLQGLLQRGFEPMSGVAPFVCARVPPRWRHHAGTLRAQGVAVRDARSFGLPDHWRINALRAPALSALWRALDHCPATAPDDPAFLSTPAP